MRKNFLHSKRFWTGAIALITGISFIFTGEKSFTDQLPFLITTAIGLFQTIVALISTDKIVAGRID
jgi:hypothetical protein|tara:strand:- start:1927 stop:2124 length:198 start_codon:yes stop_codon:yes gene_type:complete